jgi:hypothetical protein
MGPDTLVLGHDAALEPNLDTFQVGRDIDDPADQVRVDGVVVGVQAHVVVPPEPDPVAPAQVQRDRR